MWRKLAIALGIVPPPLVSTADGLASGPVRLRGALAGSRELRGPVSGKRCVGYVYDATYQMTTPKGPRRRSLRKRIAYCEALSLELDGQTIELVPQRREPPLSAEEHQALAAHGFDGFRATERRLRHGAIVEATGVLRREGLGPNARWRLTFQGLIELEPARAAAPADPPAG